MQSRELEPINGIKAFEAFGNDDDFETMESNPLSMERHVVFSTIYNELNEPYWRSVMFFLEEPKLYSSVELMDPSVENIKDTSLIQLLCSDEFFRNLEFKLGIDITFSIEKKSDVSCVVREDFTSKEYLVESTIKSIVDAMDMILMSLSKESYFELAKGLYFEYPEIQNKLKKISKKLDKYQKKFYEEMRPMLGKNT